MERVLKLKELEGRVKDIGPYFKDSELEKITLEFLRTAIPLLIEISGERMEVP